MQICKFVLIIVATICAMQNAFSQGRQIYVDANKGDDEKAGGTKNAPFKTLSRAVSHLWYLNKDNKNDITINIASGDYFLDKTLLLPNQCGGGLYWHINFEGDSQNLPRIVGGKKISDWKDMGDGVFRADIGKNLKTFSVTENGKPAREACYPNQGYLKALGGEKSEKGNYSIVSDPNFLKDFTSNCAVRIWPGCHNRVGSNYNWSEVCLRVKSVDKASGKIDLLGYSPYLIWEGNRYKLIGAKSFLDDKGEFFYDSTEGFLYYIPMSKDISKSDIFLFDLLTLVHIKGKSENEPVRDIHFKNLIFAGSAPFASVPSKESYYNSMVMISNAEDISFDGCKFINSGANALTARDWQENITVKNCLFKDCGQSAISALGAWEGSPNLKGFRDAYIAKNWTISNNAIIRVGRNIGSSSAISFNQVGDSRISNNFIKSTPRHGISLNSVAYPVMADRRYNQDITWENHSQSIFTRNIIVENNEVVDAMNDSNDGGAISSWGSSGNNTIRNNIIHNMKGFYDRAHIIGIYLDDGSSDFLVEKNIIYQMRGSKVCFPLQIKGVNNRIINNIVADNDTTIFVEIIAAGLTGLPESKGKSEALIANHTYTRNIFCADDVTALISIKPFEDYVINVCDKNLYFVKNGKYKVRLNYKIQEQDKWKFQSNNAKIDVASIFGKDPVFEDSANGNYRLKENSPALELGFENIDTTNVGLNPDFPFKTEIN